MRHPSDKIAFWRASAVPDICASPTKVELYLVGPTWNRRRKKKWQKLLFRKRSSSERFGRSSDLSINGNHRLKNSFRSSDYGTYQWGIYTFKHTAFLTQIKTKVGSTLGKTADIRVNLNIDGAPITSRSHTHPSHSQVSRLLTSPLSLGVQVPRTMECMRDV